MISTDTVFFVDYEACMCTNLLEYSQAQAILIFLYLHATNMYVSAPVVGQGSFVA